MAKKVSKATREMTIVMDARRWKFILADSEHPELADLIAGITVFTQQSVIINTDFSKDSWLSTVIHEMVHVLFWKDSGSGNSDKNKIDVELACNLVGDGLACISPATWTKIRKFLS